MKKALQITAMVLTALVPSLDAAEDTRKGRDKKDRDAETVIRMDPYRISNRLDLSYSAPIAMKIIRPRVHPKYAGMQFDLKFTVDKRGTPYNIGATDMLVDSELVFQVISAIRAWQFYPARDDEGNPVERKVILPIIVVPKL